MTGSRSKPELAALQPFDAGFRGTWGWRQPTWYRSHWELRAGEALVGTLDGSGLLGTRVVFRTRDATWWLRSSWLLQVSAFAEGGSEPVARFRSGWFGNGRITLADETTLLWKAENAWLHRFGVQTTDGLPLLHFRTRRRFLRYECDVQFEDAARRAASLPLLLGLGWLLLLHTLRNSHVAHGGA